jgi:hypothetical protein
VILRKLTQPLAEMVEAGLIPPESVVRVGHHGNAEQLTLE